MFTRQGSLVGWPQQGLSLVLIPRQERMGEAGSSGTPSPKPSIRLENGLITSVTAVVLETNIPSRCPRISV